MTPPLDPFSGFPLFHAAPDVGSSNLINGISRCAYVYPNISIASVGVNRVNPVVRAETASISLDEQATRGDGSIGRS